MPATNLQPTATDTDAIAPGVIAARKFRRNLVGTVTLIDDSPGMPLVHLRDRNGEPHSWFLGNCRLATPEEIARHQAKD